ncbi:MAG TPA: dockerin type I domain-containing protein, partial [Ignavibacteria bacterium]|nr:dockerin type I domain-containing protein [Ignavibacteria bacterium]
TASNPVIATGNLTTAGSKIEYNGTALQSVSVANIIYNGLIINNPAGASMLGNVTVNDTLFLIQGSLNLNAKIITLSQTGYLIETPGNLIYGTSGYITYTRNIGIPNSLNVGGLGAVLTAASDLGNTEVRRGLAVQSGLNGGTSIKRYYDITPANNSGLNASLVFNYDESELNGKPELLLKLFKSTNSGSTWQKMTGTTLNVNTNQITLNGITSFSRWSSDSSAASASIKMIMGGFYNASTNKLNMDDTVRVYLRNNLFPYAIVDSAKSVINLTTFGAGFQFVNAASGTYYLQMKHRNTIETWSNSAVVYNTSTTLNYDFTTAQSQAFGSNQSQVDASPLRFGMFSGDVNQDGTVDAGDLSEVENNVSIGTEGYVPTDLNGDDIVDASDLSIVENNVALGVSAVTP